MRGITLKIVFKLIHSLTFCNIFTSSKLPLRLLQTMGREPLLLLAFFYFAAGQWCRDNEVTFRRNCYLYTVPTVNMISAEESCRNIGYNLVVINDAEENFFVQNILEKNKLVSFWIGIKRDSEWRTSSSSQMLEYTHWYPDPPFLATQGKCAVIDRSGMWKNHECDEEQASTLCERQVSDGCPERAVMFKGRCYLFSSQTMDIVKAESACQLVGFDLVGIDNAEENNFLLNILQQNKLPGGWIGLVWFKSWAQLPDLVVPSYTNWASGYPSDNTNERCAYMDDTGFWKNILCTNTTQAAMMCKKSQ